MEPDGGGECRGAAFRKAGGPQPPRLAFGIGRAGWVRGGGTGLIPRPGARSPVAEPEGTDAGGTSPSTAAAAPGAAPASPGLPRGRAGKLRQAGQPLGRLGPAG